MKRMSIAGATFPVSAIVACGILVASMTGAQAAIECQPEIVKGRAGHWSYRLIDGRKCWYEGKTQIPKSELYWAESKAPETETARQSPGAPANQRATNAQASPPQAEAEEPGDPEDGSCCWPPQTGDSFEARWQSLGLRPAN